MVSQIAASSDHACIVCRQVDRSGAPSESATQNHGMTAVWAVAKLRSYPERAETGSR
jgi:hypothetical protein